MESSFVAIAGYVVGVVGVIASIFFFLRYKSAKQELEITKNLYEEATQKIEALEKNQSELLEQKSSALAKVEAMEAANKQLKEHYKEQSQTLELKLNEIMQKSLESKLQKFDETSAKKLDAMLKPLSENLKEFKEQLALSEQRSIKRLSELTKEIELIHKASLAVAEDAKNLTEALKGKKQTTGAWGEMILDTVLEYSGLIANKHYFKQLSYKDEDGKTKRPDVLIKLPREKSIIIDSKVSLVHYDAYVKAENEEQKEYFAKQLVADFKSHIDTLASKDYAHFDAKTLQYIFMFVPIEGAFATAIGHDNSLYEYALKKHIAIVTPSTLTVTLRTIYLYWQSERSSEYALKLFEEAGKLYDKIVTFSESFVKVGSQIESLQKSYEQAQKQLATGSGNILKRVSNLKTLGAKTTKNLDKTKIEYDDFEESKIEVELLEEKKEDDKD